MLDLRLGGWLLIGGVIVAVGLGCSAPRAAPPLQAQATAAPTMTWTPEPWKLTATAEVAQLGPAATTTLLPRQSREGAPPVASSTPTPEPPPVVYEACRMADGRVVYDTLNEYARDWLDAFQLASATPRLTLTSPVASLQSIRRQVEREQWPECTGQAAFYFKRAMDSAIEGFTMFMANASNESQARQKFGESSTFMRTASAQLSGIVH